MQPPERFAPTSVPPTWVPPTKVSNESVADSDPAILDALGRSMMKSLSLKIDRAFYEGSGTAPEPLGMSGQTGINTVPLSAAPTNLDPFSDAIGALAADNAVAGAIVLHPTDYLNVAKPREGTAGQRNLLQQHTGNASDASAEQTVPIHAGNGRFSILTVVLWAFSSPGTPLAGSQPLATCDSQPPSRLQPRASDSRVLPCH